MEVDVLKGKVNSENVSNQDEFEKAKEKYLIQSTESQPLSPKHCRRSSVNSHHIIYLVLISLICRANGKSNRTCSGRIRLTEPSGTISDGFNSMYSPDLQCSWLIDASELIASGYGPETLIRLKFLKFETECTWDHVYVFSGDSVFSPLVAALSGVLNPKELPEIEIRNSNVFLYFYTDTAYNMSGFNLTYTIHSCKNSDCSDVSSSSITDHCSIDQPLTNSTVVCSNMPMCPNKCSSHGECDLESKSCNCKEGYSGADCGQIKREGYWEKLTSSNSPIFGRALHASVLVGDTMWVVGGEFFEKAQSHEQFVINYDFQKSRWNLVDNQQASALNLKRYGHSLVFYNQSQSLYMYGGLLASNGTITNQLYRYNLESGVWSLVETFSHDHCTSDYCAPLSSTSHTATMVDDRMIVIFGYSHKFSFLNSVQEFHFTAPNKATATLLHPKGALVRGGYGHSAIYDESSKMIFVFGGQNSFLSDSTVVDTLYAYLPYQNKWRIMASSKSARYFHSAALINGKMYVYGGNNYNSSIESSLKCFSTQFLVYNIACDTWNHLPEPSDLILNNIGTGRFGHSAVSNQRGEMFVFGGFGKGLMLNSLLKYTPANCSQLKNKIDCCSKVFTDNCVWYNECMEYDQTLLNNHINSALTSSSGGSPKKNSHALSSDNDQNTFCHPNFNVHRPDRLTNGSFLSDHRSKCPMKFHNNEKACKKITSCPNCLENSAQCVWCNDSRTCGEKCKAGKVSKTCDAEDSLQCEGFHTCSSCHTKPYCTWNMNGCYLSSNPRNPRPHCEPACSLQTTCENCTLASNCIWCAGLNRCIESNAYGAMFMLGNCLNGWTVHPSRCSLLSCANQGTCERCHQLASCGWCDDGTGTGSGYCIEGNSKGSINLEMSASSLDSSLLQPQSGNKSTATGANNLNNKHLTDITNRIINLESLFSKNELDLYSSADKPSRMFSSPSRPTCKGNRWFYTECPLCQCSGHSTCKPGTSICQQPCKNHTTGEHCDTCENDYFGDPTNNNGKGCKRCGCVKNHTSHCDNRSGRCYCSTKGVHGPYCDKCDEANHYFRDGANCWYNLSTDFAYTFQINSSKSVEIERYYTKIDFKNIPPRPDLDVDFTLTCSSRALFNISFGSATLPHRVLQERIECGSQFKYRFSHNEHLFGAENASFYVSVYEFSYPFILQISFSQHRALDLIQFFVTFSSCFIFLLIVAAILWKIKQKYDMYRRRQQFFMELEHLASRPFASILLELPNQEAKKRPQRTSVMSGDLDDASNAALTAAGNQQAVATSGGVKPSKLKAFTSAQRSHLKNFLHSSSNNTSSNAAGGDQLLKTQQTPNSSSLIENPTPIALEPCFNNKAAVLSLIIRLPTGGTGVIPIGQTGIAIGSALVSLGPVEQAKMHDNNVKGSNSNKKTNAGPAYV